MFAYCNNNPVNASDKNGKIPDTFAGWIGEEIGKFIYEWITGEDHPSREAERIEAEITQQQNEMTQSVTTALWNAWVHSNELQVDQKYRQDMTVKREIESWVENPVRGMDFATMTTSNVLTYVSYVSFALNPAIGSAVTLTIGAVCATWTTLRYFEVIK